MADLFRSPFETPTRRAIVSPTIQKGEACLIAFISYTRFSSHCFATSVQSYQRPIP